MEVLTFYPLSPSALDFVTRVANAYGALLESAHADPEKALGGRLFYAGDLDDEARALLIAANIAGAASLAATADRNLQKQALRDGVTDFVVNNLDEALRILKNQLRKREAVAVCVALPRSDVEQEMDDRGVAPDMLRAHLFVARSGPAPVIGAPEQPDFKRSSAFVTWRVDSAMPKDLAALDDIALSCLDPNEWESRRWLRLAPRYLGRMAQGMRLIHIHREFAARFFEQARRQVDRKEIAFAFEIHAAFRGGNDQFRFDPPKTPPTNFA